ncbi:MAG: hypothetical protein ABFC94_10590 [Syntrophomonas sp.]
MLDENDKVGSLTKENNALSLKNFKLMIVLLILLTICIDFIGQEYFATSSKYQSLCMNLAALIAGGLFSVFIRDMLLGDYFERRTKDNIVHLFDTNTALMSGAHNCGIERIFSCRNEEFYDAIKTEFTKMRFVSKEFDKNDKYFKILGNSCSDFLDKQGRLKNILTRVLEDDFKVQALICNPNSEYPSERDKCEDIKGTKEKIISSCSQAETFKKNNNFSLTLYWQPPMTFLVITKTFLFVSPYSYGDTGYDMPIFQIKPGSQLYKSYIQHFNFLWSKWDNIKQDKIKKAAKNKSTQEKDK